MRFIHRNRRSLSVVSLLAFVFGMGASATPAAAEYNARFGRFLQTDPNGTGLILSPSLGYLGSNPTVTVSMAYQLQYGDGMNFYQYLRSNAVNHTDPTGLFTVTDLLTTQSLSTYLRTAGAVTGIGSGVAGLFGGIRSGYEAQLLGGTPRDIAIAAVKGAGFTGYKAFARVLIASAIIATGPGGLALAGSIGVFQSADAYCKARERQESAQTEADIKLATFDSIFATLGIGGSLFATSAGIRGAAIAARASLPRLPSGNSGVWQGTFRGAKFRADAVRNGTELQLNNVWLGGEIGSTGFRALLAATKHVARAEGFTRLRIFTVRSSGRLAGTVSDRVFYLD